MKYLLIALVALFCVGCAGEESNAPIYLDQGEFFKMSGLYRGVVTIVEDGEVTAVEKETSVRVYQSADGPGTFWGGAIGSAGVDGIDFDYSYPTFSLSGWADANGAHFNIVRTFGGHVFESDFTFEDLELVNEHP